MTTPRDILQHLETSPHATVKVAGCDIDGILRGKYLAKEKVPGALERGFGFCDVVFGWDSADVLYDNAQVTGWHTGYPDALVRLDPATFRTIPWEEGKPFLLGDFATPQGAPHPACPRNLLKRVIGEARGLGFEPHAACEFEYFLFEETPHSLHEKNFRDPKPLSPGMFGYSILRASARSPLLHQIVDAMKAFRCPIEGIHTETGPGVFETALQHAPALEAADRAILFKTGMKELAYRHGTVATFMAKWNDKLPGCSGHLHMSLWSKETTTNLFADGNGGDGMSDTFRHFVAGVLATLPDLMACYAPTVNSYKRSVPGVWSPVNVSWGHENRTTALRTIAGGPPAATRVEQRVTGADINPYVAMAATLAAGLYGIRKRLPLAQKPVDGDAYALSQAEAPLLPRTLADAAARMKGSAVAREILGEAFVDHYVRTREWEVREWRKAVTDWERRRYFEII